jgi:WD40 repeat protein
MSSNPLDILLTAPSEDDLVAALDQANQRLRSAHGRKHWRVLLDEIADNAEGRSQLEHARPDEFGARYLSAAWWTDHRGTKHVRICGGDTSRGNWHPHYSRLDHDIRPPLWHVFGERVYRVTRPGQEPRWLASCACGETGEPPALAWMGPRCGPCHDRREDGQPYPDQGQELLTGQGRGYAVAFSPDGRHLAVSSAGRIVNLHDLESGEMRGLYADDDTEPYEEFRPLVFSPDGRYLAAGDPDEWLIRIWDLQNDDYEHEEWLPGEGSDDHIRSLAFSPDSRLLAAAGGEGPIVWEWQDGRFEGVWHLIEPSFAAAFSPDGQALALGGDGGTIRINDCSSSHRLIKIVEGSGVIGEEVMFLHYTPDGHRLVMIVGTTGISSSGTPHVLRLLDLKGDRELASTNIPSHTRVAALSADRRYLASIVHDEQHSPGEILFWDLLTWKQAGRLEWNPEDALNDLAFSPDSQTLATVSEAGVVKRWPWRLLLES